MRIEKELAHFDLIVGNSTSLVAETKTNLNLVRETTSAFLMLLRDKKNLVTDNNVNGGKVWKGRPQLWILPLWLQPMH